MGTSELLVIIIAGLGPITGAILARIAPEELEDGNPYFRAMFGVMASTVAVLALWDYVAYWSFFSVVIALLLWKAHDTRLSYSAIALVLPVMLTRGEAHYAAIALFLVGMAAGTLACAEFAENDWMPFIRRTAWFLPSLAVNLVLFLLL